MLQPALYKYSMLRLIFIGVEATKGEYLGHKKTPPGIARRFRKNFAGDGGYSELPGGSDTFSIRRILVSE